MVTKKIVKLINGERVNRALTASKACDATSTDICAEKNYDYAHCTVYSTDLCVKDYAGCTEHTIDYCSGYQGRDFNACGYGVDDYT